MVRSYLAAAAILAFGSALPAKAQNDPYYDRKDPERVIIGLDMSASNPLVEDREYARKVGMRVASRLGQLSVKSEVLIRPLGVYNSTTNDSLRMDIVVSAKNRPEDLAMKVEQLIAGIPDFVASGKLAAEGYTNILAFLENMSQTVDCGSLKTTYILVSDGLEDSQYTALRQVDAALPLDVLRVDGEKCDELQILGVGRGVASPQETKRIRDAWQVWAVDSDGAPFKKFFGLNDW